MFASQYGVTGFSLRGATGVKSYGMRRQSGTALVVSLIILAVVTLLGVTSMQSSNTELKLAASQRDRGVAFEAAGSTGICERNTKLIFTESA